ncbi:MAG: hypothetical protein OEZ43_12510 [Gammaproteobacteria bacterium]|nr:hypothetical protein [Gammaproteobacteria bacterium]
MAWVVWVVEEAAAWAVWAEEWAVACRPHQTTVQEQQHHTRHIESRVDAVIWGAGIYPNTYH